MKEVVTAIRHFSNNKSPGHDQIPAEFYKEQPVCWSPVLAHLFFLFLKNSFYPPEWGFVKVTPIFKEKGDPHDPTNYRPISLCGFRKNHGNNHCKSDSETL